MVSLKEQDSIVSRAKNDKELGTFYAFLFDESLPNREEAAFPHDGLLQSIRAKDSERFQKELKEIERRHVSDETPWCDNDYLVFLLLLGCELFQCKSSCLDRILTVREKNPNEIPRKVNQIFRALSRQEFSMEGDYCFVKVPFLKIVGQLHLSAEPATKVYHSLTKPGLLDELPPLFQLLAIRAFELVLLDRKPTKFESFPQLVEGIQNHSKNLSFAQFWQLLVALPFKNHLVVMAILLSVGATLFGVGQKALELWWNRELSRQVPETLAVTESFAPDRSQERLIKAVTTQLLAAHPPSGKEQVIAIGVKSSTIKQPSPRFSVEISHSTYDCIDGYAFMEQVSEGGSDHTVLPVQKADTRLRTLVPESSGERRISFVVLVEARAGVTLNEMGKGFVLRPLP